MTRRDVLLEAADIVDSVQVHVDRQPRMRTAEMADFLAAIDALAPHQRKRIIAHLEEREGKRDPRLSCLRCNGSGVLGPELATCPECSGRGEEPSPEPAPIAERRRPHIIDGEFQSDKYPTCPRGKVPLSVKDPTAQDLLWEYAQRRRSVDAEFADDLEFALAKAGYIRAPVAEPSDDELSELYWEIADSTGMKPRRALYQAGFNAGFNAAKQTTAPDAKADGTQREQYEKQPDGESPQSHFRKDPGATVNEGTGINPTSQPAPGVVGSSPQVDAVRLTKYGPGPQSPPKEGKPGTCTHCNMARGDCRVCGKPIEFGGVCQSRHVHHDCERKPSPPKLDAFGITTPDPKPDMPESDEAGAQEMYDNHLADFSAAEWFVNLTENQREKVVAAFRFARDIGRAERDKQVAALEARVLREADARSGWVEHAQKAGAELAEAKAKLAEWEGMFDAIRAVISPERRPEPEKGE